MRTFKKKFTYDKLTEKYYDKGLGNWAFEGFFVQPVKGVTQGLLCMDNFSFTAMNFYYIDASNIIP